jgi:ATP-dependent DNA ligase
VSRNGNTYRSFPQLAQAIAATIPGPAVLDGEIVCINDAGAPQFYQLMRRRHPQYFAAFDLLWQDGTDLRLVPLLERKRRLCKMIPSSGAAFYVDHVRRLGCQFYESVCARDLEGIVAKRSDGLYTSNDTSWVKIRNPKYSQWDGHRELFDRRRGRRKGIDRSVLNGAYADPSSTRTGTKKLPGEDSTGVRIHALPERAS